MPAPAPDLPPPFTPPECDLSDFQYMELDVRRLRDSRFAAGVEAEGFRAGILLWCAAWHQIPAASLPDDDVELANLAGYGRVVKEWKKVREDALHGFVKCADGRLYHAVIAEKALSAHAAKEKYAYAKYCERMRKENAKREKESKAQFGVASMALWKTGAYPHGIPPGLEPNLESNLELDLAPGIEPEPGRIPPEIAQSAAAIDSETVLKENRTERSGNGEGDLLTAAVPDGTGAGGAGDEGGDEDKNGATTGASQQAGKQFTKDELWKAGKSLLQEAGLPKAQCGSFVGKLVKDYGDAIVVDAVRAAIFARPADPVEYLKASCMRAKGERKSEKAGGKFQLAGLDRAGDQAAQAESMRRHGIAAGKGGEL